MLRRPLVMSSPPTVVESSWLSPELAQPASDELGLPTNCIKLEMNRSFHVLTNASLDSQAWCA